MTNLRRTAWVLLAVLPLAARGLTALKGSYSADVTAYFVDPAPTQAQLTPLVQKALDQL